MSRKPSDRTLPMDERLCSTLINSIRGIVWEADPVTFRFSYVSPQAEQILGYPCRQWTDEPDFWHKHTHPEDVEWCAAFCRDSTEKGEDHEFDYRMVAADGRIVWLHDIVTVTTDDDGTVRMRGIMIDITASRLADLRLRQSEERFSLAMQGANDGLFDWNLKTDEVYYSPRWKSMLGYADDELTNDLGTWAALVHPEDREPTLSLAQDYLEGRVGRFETEFRMRHKDGHYLTVLSRAFLARGEDDSPRMVGTHVDITDLREQKELYGAIVSEAPDSVVLVDAETLAFREFNSAAYEGLGYTREEFAHMSVRDVNAQFDLKAHDRTAQEMMEHGHAVFETIHRHKNGSLQQVRVGARAMEIRGRQYFVAIWTNITEQKRLLEALKLRDHYQRAILDNFPFPAWLKDTEGRYLSVNKPLAESLGLSSPDELVGRSLRDYFPPEVANQLDAEDRKVLACGLPRRAEEEIPLNGALRWFEVFQSPIATEGKFIGTVGCLWDVTERKSMEKALAESEERYRKLVEVSPDAIFIHVGGKFAFMNLTAARLLGAERPEDLYGRAAIDFVHPDSRPDVAQRVDNALSGRDNPPIEELLLRLDGSTVPVEMVSVYLNYQSEDGVLAVARDISERKRMQEELLRAQKLESLGVLAGGIAHDFNNILTGILGNLSLVCNLFVPPENVARALDRCEKAALRASELTQQLLTFARGGDPVRRLMEPAPLIRESVNFVLKGSNIRSEMTLADDLWCFEADSGQINQVLSNILINARQAMPHGGFIRISAANEVIGADNVVNLPPGGYLKVVIEDQGEGIPPAHLSKIFDPFFTTKKEGNGLGLASVYSIIKRHGGIIQVSSTVGVGTSFTLHLPAVPEKQAKGDVSAKERLVAGKGRILIMDDEEIIRELGAEILHYAGYSVETCADGREAVRRYRRSKGGNDPFDAVIMDLTVPGGMGGKEAAQAILEIDPGAVLIVSSGYSNDPVIASFRHHGFKGSVVKPFSAGTLTAEVQRLIQLPGAEA